jgi:hypothetical protein
LYKENNKPNWTIKERKTLQRNRKDKI